MFNTKKIYHLYIKTHLTTGLKYLGQTCAKDPHKYKGSGIYWTNHLKEHGTNYATEILLTTNNKNDITEKGLYYSNLWNVVESSEWANLKPEIGDGGGKPPVQKGKRYWNNGVKNTMSFNCPGPEWTPGKLTYCNKEELSKKLSRLAKKRLTKKMRNYLRKKSIENGSSPPDQTGKKFWNNGIEQTTAFECPGIGWKQGGLPRKKHIFRSE